MPSGINANVRALQVGAPPRSTQSSAPTATSTTASRPRLELLVPGWTAIAGGTALGAGTAISAARAGSELTRLRPLPFIIAGAAIALGAVALIAAHNMGPVTYTPTPSTPYTPGRGGSGGSTRPRNDDSYPDTGYGGGSRNSPGDSYRAPAPYYPPSNGGNNSPGDTAPAPRPKPKPAPAPAPPPRPKPPAPAPAPHPRPPSGGDSTRNRNPSEDDF